MILAVGYFAADRVAVHMHIQRAHENRDLYAAVGKIFISLYFFNDHHFTISRGDDSIFFYCQLSFGDTEKEIIKMSKPSVTIKMIQLITG